MEKGGWVTIMANRYRGGTYVVVTSDLIRRVWQLREGTQRGKRRIVTPKGSQAPCQARGDGRFWVVIW